MENFVIAFMLTILSWTGGPQDPKHLLPKWTILQNWQMQDSFLVFAAESKTIPTDCSQMPKGKVLFPQVIHGVHEILGDGKLLYSSGDKSFQLASAFYSRPILDCQLLSQYQKIQWQVSSYSRFFARFHQPVEIKVGASSDIFFNSTTNVSAAAILLILCLFSSIIYYRKVSHQLTFSVACASLFFAIYFMFADTTAFGLSISMLEAHRIADIGLWLGGLCILYAFYLENSISGRIFVIQLVVTFLALIIILLGQNGDSIQFGTIVPMPGWLVCSLSVLQTNIWNRRHSHWSKVHLLKSFTALMLMGFGIHDITTIFGIGSNLMLLPFGLVGAMLGLSLTVNQNIEKTYQERDQLLSSLDLKVNEKTRELQDTLLSLKNAQSELIQSAKLASLGTLSAGIAHEINNSINYVFGAIVPLERLIHKLIPIQDREKVDKLLHAIKEGTRLTIEIVNSLRTYTGLNQSQFKTFYIKTTFDAVLTILKSRLLGVKIKLEVDPNVKISGSLVAMNQVLMNLITNALDALPKDNPTLEMGARLNGNHIIIWVKDNGSGIAPDHLQRIFEPFYTTKEVGKGTGLGLHIIKNEVERHRGTIAVSSVVGEGTCFEVSLPSVDELRYSEREVA